MKLFAHSPSAVKDTAQITTHASTWFAALPIKHRIPSSRSKKAKLG